MSALSELVERQSRQIADLRARIDELEDGRGLVEVHADEEVSGFLGSVTAKPGCGSQGRLFGRRRRRWIITH